jgi:hypothetical protein
MQGTRLCGGYPQIKLWLRWLVAWNAVWRQATNRKALCILVFCAGRAAANGAGEMSALRWFKEPRDTLVFVRYKAVVDDRR